MDTTIIHHLEAGQSLRLHLRRGDRLWLQQGSLLAEPPVLWLGDRLLRRQEHWPEGQAWTADAAAAWQCRAPRAATLCVQRRAPWWSRGFAALAALSAPAAPALPPPAAPRPRPSAAAARFGGTPAR